jgi:hypothetical protein
MSLNVPSANLPYANTNFPNGAQAWYITGMGEQVFNSPYQTNMCLNWHVPGKADWNTVTPKADYRSPQIVFQQENLLDPTANVWGPTNYFGIASIQGNLQIGAATNSLQYTNLEVLSHGLLDRVFDYTMIPGKYISIDQQGVLYGNGAGLTNVPDSRYVRSYITAFNPIVNQPVFFTDAPGSSKGMILPPAASWVADLPQWDKFQAAQWTNIVFTCKVYATNNTSTDWHMFLEGPTNTAGASRNQVLQTSDVNRTVVASNWVAFSMTHKPTRYQLTNMQFMQVAIYNNTNKTYWIEGIIVTNAP